MLSISYQDISYRQKGRGTSHLGAHNHKTCLSSVKVEKKISGNEQLFLLRWPLDEKPTLEGGLPIRLGYALLLKCFQYEGRFPSARHEISKDVVNYVANQLKLDPALYIQYDWDGRTIKAHRT